MQEKNIETPQSLVWDLNQKILRKVNSDHDTIVLLFQSEKQNSDIKHENTQRFCLLWVHFGASFYQASGWSDRPKFKDHNLVS